MQSYFLEVIRKNNKQLHTQWMNELSRNFGTDNRISRTELAEQTAEFLRSLEEAVHEDGRDGAQPSKFQQLHRLIEEISRSRALQGFTPEQTASFIFSLKKPIFATLRQSLQQTPEALADEIWNATELIDGLGLHSFNAYQRAREEVISRQRDEILELSTPVVKLWEGILALPMIGTLDSARAQTMMESLLERIVETGSPFAIIDITGVPTVDTLVAQHLLKTIAAIRLMGAECIISGIRPQIAQTIVHLGINLEGVTTRSTLADALALALRRTGLTISPTQPRS